MRAAVLLVGLSVLAGCGEPEAETHSTERMLEAANAEKDRAMVAGDAAALENFYTADYHLIDDDGEVHDKRSQVEFMTRDADLISAASSDVQVRMLGKNAALVTGRVRGKYRQDGRESPFDQRFTTIWVTEDSQWRVRHEHSSEVKSRR